MATGHHPYLTLAAMFVLTFVMPIVLGQMLLGAGDVRWTSVPLHSVMEATGGIIAVVISMIFYIKYAKALVLTHFNWSTGALLAMGIIDIFHASVMPGNLFVWLHSTAVFFGGLFFVTVWLPDRRVRSSAYRAMPIFFSLFALLFGAGSLVWGASLPAMLNPEGGFSATANALNILGGIGFFIAAGRFVMGYLVSGDAEELLFAGHTMLFGTAGVLFVSSAIWDLQWWLWHLLRLLAYAVAFYLLYMAYRRDLKNIEQTNRKLEIANRKISEYLDIVDRHVITSATDVRGIITDVSQAFCDVSGYSKEELIGRSHSIVRHPDMPAELYREIWKTIRSGRPWHGEIKNRAKSGAAYWVDAVIAPQIDSAGRTTGYTAIRQEVTDKKRVERLSITDELSGLFNRRHFNTMVPKECGRAQRGGHGMALAILDIDHFKQYNDTYGHEEGDQVIRAVGALLKSFTRRPGDAAFRLGGEEFGVLYGFDAPEAAEAYAEKIRAGIEGLALTHSMNSAAPVVTVSVGVASFKAQSAGACASLYRTADSLLYRAKSEGRNRVVFESEQGAETTIGQ